jgi:hypothetical protein
MHRGHNIRSPAQNVGSHIFGDSADFAAQNVKGNPIVIARAPRTAGRKLCPESISQPREPPVIERRDEARALRCEPGFCCSRFDAADLAARGRTRALALKKLRRICQAEVRRLKAKHTPATVKLYLSK